VKAEFRRAAIAYIRERPPRQTTKDGAGDGADGLRWMVYALALVSDGDGEATEIVRRNADKSEQPDEWVRFWALAGLARSGRPNLFQTVQDWTKNEPESSMVKLVATAIGAREGVDAARRRLQSAAKSMDGHCKAAMRALRVCSVDDEKVVDCACDIVNKGDHPDITYDALKALSHVRHDSQWADRAAQALQGFVIRWRSFQGRDSMRAVALVGLGKLKAASAADLLVEELVDDNPLTAREAARSLEQILETPIVVRRVIEAAVRRQSGRRAYADALRQMQRQDEIAAELERMMVSSAPVEQECCREVLIDMGGIDALQKLRARSEMMTQFKEVLKNADRSIEGLVESMKTEARKGFWWALSMDTTIFAVGTGLLVASAVLALVTNKSLTDWIALGGTGATGIGGVLYGLLVGKPRQQVTQEVDHLVAIQVVIHGYLRQLYETDQAFIRLILDDAPVTDIQLGQFAARIQAALDAAVNAVGRYRTT
jgi:hypothetical protein